MSNKQNKPETPDARDTVEKLERVTVETIETIERVTITGVSTTARIVTEFVQVTADAVIRAQQEFERNQALLDSIEIGPEIDPNMASYYVIDNAVIDNAGDDPTAFPSGLDAAQREELIRLHEVESSMIEELSEEIIISEQSESDLADAVSDTVLEDDTAPEDDTMPMHIQNQEWHQQNEAENADTIQYKPVKILVRKSALAAAKAHAEEDVRNEVGGILLGDYYTTEEGERIALIAGIVRARKARQRPASLNFTPEAWADVWRLIDGDEEYGADEMQWKMMGWYHTHPNFGIFFSGADHTVHDPHFTHPCHVALVIDPCRREYGFFAKANLRTPAAHCHQKQCEALGDTALVTRWIEATDQKLDLPKTEIPAGKLEEEVASTSPEESNAQPENNADNHKVVGDKETNDIEQTIEKNEPESEPAAKSDDAS